MERTMTGRACSDASPEHTLQEGGAQGFPWVEMLPLCLTDTKFGFGFFFICLILYSGFLKPCRLLVR